MTQKAVVAVLDKPKGTFTLKEYPLSDPAPGTVLIKQEMCGVCGTDMHMYHGRLPGILYPMVMGHEIVGRIAALGKGVKTDFLGRELKEGDRVILDPGIACGKCYLCNFAKTPACCMEGFCYGFNDSSQYPLSGGFGEYVYLHEPGTSILKTELPAELAVLAEPLSCGIYAVRRSKIKLGDTVVIQGSGAIGLSAQIAARLSGAGKIIHIGGPSDLRIELAKTFGADVTVNVTQVTDPQDRIQIVKDQTRGIGADVVFECSGTPAAIPEGLDMLRISGTFVEMGHFTDVGDITLNPFAHLCNKNINLQGTWGAETEDMVRALQILENRFYPYDRLITHKMPLNRLNDIMTVPEKGYILDDKECLKVVVCTI